MTSLKPAGGRTSAPRSRGIAKIAKKGASFRDLRDFSDDYDLIVAGGGPAGMMAGLLFARAGCQVLVLEKHADFFRDFRGDTVHPSTMEVLGQLGVLDRFLKRPHTKIHRAELRLAGKEWHIAELSRLHTPAPFIAMMPQWDLLDFLRDEAGAYPGFHLAMSTPVENLVEERGRVVGVLLKDGRELRARLTIAADGRDSIVRRRLPLEELSAPIDVLWFKVAKAPSAEGSLRFAIGGGAIIVLMDRDTYWQCAFVIPKGDADTLLAGGLEPVRERLRMAVPDLGLSGLRDTDDFKLLTVTIDRLTKWHSPGLLAIGDAAHAMSPVGGVGINLAIQDAVAAANILAGPLATGQEVESLLHEVRDRRLWPTRFIQRAQIIIQNRIIWPMLQKGEGLKRAPLVARMFNRFPFLRGIPGRLMGLGVRRERVRSPEAPRSS